MAQLRPPSIAPLSATLVLLQQTQAQSSRVQTGTLQATTHGLALEPHASVGLTLRYVSCVWQASMLGITSPASSSGFDVRLLPGVIRPSCGKGEGCAGDAGSSLDILGVTKKLNISALFNLLWRHYVLKGTATQSVAPQLQAKHSGGCLPPTTASLCNKS